MSHRLHDGSGNWDHLNLIFPVYLKLMTGFPSVHSDDVGAKLLHGFGFGYCGVEYFQGEPSCDWRGLRGAGHSEVAGREMHS